MAAIYIQAQLCTLLRAEWQRTRMRRSWDCCMSCRKMGQENSLHSLSSLSLIVSPTRKLKVPFWIMCGKLMSQTDKFMVNIAWASFIATTCKKNFQHRWSRSLDIAILKWRVSVGHRATLAISTQWWLTGLPYLWARCHFGLPSGRAVSNLGPAQISTPAHFLTDEPRGLHDGAAKYRGYYTQLNF